jgi:hypothetical protein
MAGGGGRGEVEVGWMGMFQGSNGCGDDWTGAVVESGQPRHASATPPAFPFRSRCGPGPGPGPPSSASRRHNLRAEAYCNLGLSGCGRCLTQLASFSTSTKARIAMKKGRQQSHEQRDSERMTCVCWVQKTGHAGRHKPSTTCGRAARGLQNSPHLLLLRREHLLCFRSDPRGRVPLRPPTPSLRRPYAYQAAGSASSFARVRPSQANGRKPSSPAPSLRLLATTTHQQRG